MTVNAKLRSDILRDIPDIDHPRANALRNGAGECVSVPVTLWHNGQKVLSATVACPPSSAALYLPALLHVATAMERAGIKPKWDQASFLRDDIRHDRAALEADMKFEPLSAFIKLQQQSNIPFAMATGHMLQGIKRALEGDLQPPDMMRQKLDISLAVYEAALHRKYATVQSPDLPQKKQPMRWLRRNAMAR